MITTKNGFKWSKTEDGWKDEQTGLVWLPVEPNRYTHYEALKLQNDIKRLPAVDEMWRAWRHGVCDVIADFRYYWYWTSLNQPYYNNYYYSFNGRNGRVGVYNRATYDSVRMVLK